MRVVMNHTHVPMYMDVRLAGRIAGRVLVAMVFFVHVGMLVHLPGALNIPLRQLERRLSEIPLDQEILAYCRGPYCFLSFEAVAALRTPGFNLRRLEEGFPEWKASGLPVAIAA
jgi:rhodanese-related sulfurtransferase